jgi:hypothetical protein
MNQQRGTSCPNTLHDWPLPIGYIAASDTAAVRLRARWRNNKCPDCGLYGWIPGQHKPGTRPVHVTATNAAEEKVVKE